MIQPITKRGEGFKGNVFTRQYNVVWCMGKPSEEEEEGKEAQSQEWKTQSQEIKHLK